MANWYLKFFGYCILVIGDCSQFSITGLLCNFEYLELKVLLLLTIYHMEGGLISQLGIDWKLLTAQIVNFTILLLILKKFLYMPVLDMLHKRSNVIAKSIQEAKKIEEDCRKLEADKEKEMSEARIKAKNIISEAAGLAEKEKEKIIFSAHEDSSKMMLNAKNIIRMQKEQMLKETEKEVGMMAVAVVEKFFKTDVSKSDQEKIIKNVVAGV